MKSLVLLLTIFTVSCVKPLTPENKLNIVDLSTNDIEAGACKEIANNSLVGTRYMDMDDGSLQKINLLGSDTGIAVIVHQVALYTGKDGEQKRKARITVKEGSTHVFDVSRDAFGKTGWIKWDYSSSAENYESDHLAQLEDQAYFKFANSKPEAHRCKADKYKTCGIDCGEIGDLGFDQCLAAKKRLKCPDHEGEDDERVCKTDCGQKFGNDLGNYNACIGRKFRVLSNSLFNWESDACGGFAKYTCKFDCEVLEGVERRECIKQHSFHCKNK